MFDVVALGESLIDFTPNGTNAQDIELFARNPGGAPANVLAMNARLGGKTAFIGKVGKDGFGDFLRQTLVESSIDVSGLVIDEKIPTTLAFVQLDSKGDRSFTFYRNPGADVMLTSAEVNRNLIDDAAIFHFGSVSLTADPSRTATLEAARYGGNSELHCLYPTDVKERIPYDKITDQNAAGRSGQGLCRFAVQISL